MLHATKPSFSSRHRSRRKDTNRAGICVLFCALFGVVFALSGCFLLGRNNHGTDSLRSGMDKKKVLALLGPPGLAFVCIPRFACEPVSTSGEYPKDSIPSGMSSALCLSYEPTSGTANLVLLGPDDKLVGRARFAYQGPNSDPTTVSKESCWSFVSQEMKVGTSYHDLVGKKDGKDVWESYTVKEFQRY